MFSYFYSKNSAITAKHYIHFSLSRIICRIPHSPQICIFLFQTDLLIKRIFLLHRFQFPLKHSERNVAGNSRYIGIQVMLNMMMFNTSLIIKWFSRIYLYLYHTFHLHHNNYLYDLEPMVNLFLLKKLIKKFRRTKGFSGIN